MFVQFLRDFVPSATLNPSVSKCTSYADFPNFLKIYALFSIALISTQVIIKKMGKEFNKAGTSFVTKQWIWTVFMSVCQIELE